MIVYEQQLVVYLFTSGERALHTHTSEVDVYKPCTRDAGAIHLTSNTCFPPHNIIVLIFFRLLNPNSTTFLPQLQISTFSNTLYVTTLNRL